MPIPSSPACSLATTYPPLYCCQHPAHVGLQQHLPFATAPPQQHMAPHPSCRLPATRLVVPSFIVTWTGLLPPPTERLPPCNITLAIIYLHMPASTAAVPIYASACCVITLCHATCNSSLPLHYAYITSLCLCHLALTTLPTYITVLSPSPIYTG